MNRSLQYLNLIGVLALAALCVAQWRANRAVNLEAAGLAKTRLQQQEKLAEQEKALKGYEADLDQFRGQLTRASGELKTTQARVAGLERESHQLELERNQLRTSVTNWAAAVAARDAQLKQAREVVEKLAVERDTAVGKFNDLAEKYNAVVKDLNEERSRQAASRTNKAPAGP